MKTYPFHLFVRQSCWASQAGFGLVACPYCSGIAPFTFLNKSSVLPHTCSQPLRAVDPPCGCRVHANEATGFSCSEANSLPSLNLKSVDRQQDGMEPTEGKLREQFGVSYKNTHAALMDSAVISWASFKWAKKSCPHRLAYKLFSKTVNSCLYLWELMTEFS